MVNATPNPERRSLLDRILGRRPEGLSAELGAEIGREIRRKVIEGVLETAFPVVAKALMAVQQMKEIYERAAEKAYAAEGRMVDREIFLNQFTVPHKLRQLFLNRVGAVEAVPADAPVPPQPETSPASPEVVALRESAQAAEELLQELKIELADGTPDRDARAEAMVEEMEQECRAAIESPAETVHREDRFPVENRPAAADNDYRGNVPDASRYGERVQIPDEGYDVRPLNNEENDYRADVRHVPRNGDRAYSRYGGEEYVGRLSELTGNERYGFHGALVPSEESTTQWHENSRGFRGRVGYDEPIVWDAKRGMFFAPANSD